MRILPFLMIFLSPIAVANQGNIYNQEVRNAQNAVSQSLNQPAFKGFDVNSYCEDIACQQQIQNPDQSKYFGNDAGMIDDGNIALANDPNAKNIVDAQKKRPKYDIDPNDPALVRAKGFMDDSYNISHGISSKYHDCENGSSCQLIDTKRQCDEPTTAPLSCTSELVLDEEYFVNHSGRWNYDHTNRPVSGLEMPIINHHINTVTVNGFKLSINSRSEMIGISINGKMLKTVQMQSSNGLFIISNVQVPVNQLLPHKSVMHFHRMNTGGQQINGYVHDNVYIMAQWKEKRVSTKWLNQCQNLPPECSSSQFTCIEGPETRIINGVEVYRSCWKKRETYTCRYPNTCSNLLTNPNDTLTCKLSEPDKRYCKIAIQNQCLVYDVTLSCVEKKCEDINLICGEASFCLEGDCYAGEGQKNDDFAESAAGLGALGAAAEDFSEDTVKIFTGKPAFCDKKPVGLSDCCSDDGWGNDIGLTQCSEEEIGLGQAKDKGLTIKLGEYCAEDVLGVCIRKKQSYCQFDSKMARIIQEQGKVQLGLSFGNKKNPNCIGITPEQMQQLDFSKIDFSDFYEDMEEGMALPDMEHLQNTITDKFTDIK
ncbi:type-F conjugative transfer system mating-pair stabilization protein TraN [Vibrio sp. OPT18]|uniref:type-F conjugative transfer system mating-pair stabilization protein TraN n=1 Tax=Vibrio sp. OPT18 TaxID=2778641 RepID=UPI001881DB46|nr:type-F conjugative transfer system mating-pair stabilization protein TraN [Vibrio sp. OPT18]MBE8574105.1 type-F conjugative transfer system mating-pair stabilization protein TraN [Vibrio sp. OPT18]